MGEDTIDVGGLFRGTATITFIVEIITGIMMLGAGGIFVVTRTTFIQDLDPDFAILLLMIVAIITLFIFLGAIGFFIRYNKKIQGLVIGPGIGEVDLKKPRVKAVISLYGLAVGLILIIGMYLFWLAWQYLLSPIASSSLSFLAFAVALAVFILSLLIQLVIIALGRTATRVVQAVLVEKPE